jgi:hypothetical protein
MELLRLYFAEFLRNRNPLETSSKRENVISGRRGGPEGGMWYMVFCDVTAGCAAKYIAKPNFSQQNWRLKKCKKCEKIFSHSFSLRSFSSKFSQN